MVHVQVQTNFMAQKNSHMLFSVLIFLELLEQWLNVKIHFG